MRHPFDTTREFYHGSSSQRMFPPGSEMQRQLGGGRVWFLAVVPELHLSTLRSPKGFSAAFAPLSILALTFQPGGAPGLVSLHLHFTAACVEMLADKDKLCSPMGGR